MTPRVSVPVFVLLGLTAAGLAGFIFYGRFFPPELAVHFAADGTPDRWMDRVMFIVVMSSVSFMLPPFVTAVVGVLPRVLPPAALNVPNAGYWRAPAHVDAARGRMLYFGAWLGCLVQVFVLGATVLIVRANGPVPADPLGGVRWLTAAFALALVFWTWRFLRSFARPAA